MLKELELIDEKFFKELYEDYESISKMLLGMFRSYNG
jgi:hypothetical protein